MFGMRKAHPATALPDSGPMLSPHVREALRLDGRRIVITGASGWIGRATLALLADAIGERVHQRVLCLGSAARTLEITDDLSFDQRPLAELGMLDCQDTLLLHLAFLTKDKVGDMSADDYRRGNRALGDLVLDALDRIGANRVFLASSGAARFADDQDAAADLRLYGQLKRDDEDRFAAWAHAAPGRRAIIGRIFNIAGPHINKHQSYALASLILDALAGRPVSVRATHAVVRGHVAIRELMSLVFALLLDRQGEPVIRFDSGGTPMELSEVAQVVAETLGASVADRPALSNDQSNIYVGDDEGYRTLLARHSIDSVPFRTQVIETATYLAATSTS